MASSERAMQWTGQIFAYCERGLDPAFWAEPLNAASNLAFFAAAGWGAYLWARSPAGRRGLLELALIAVVLAIGTGSFLFHTLATRWAGVADTVPIGIFMVGYLAYALRRLVGCSALITAALTIGFVATLPAASMVRCGGGPCLNGSVAYLPALLALAATGAWLVRGARPAGRLLLIAAAIFAVSLTFRSVDRMICPYTVLRAAGGIGTHFLWHLLNGVLIALLLDAALRYGMPARRPAASAA